MINPNRLFILPQGEFPADQEGIPGPDLTGETMELSQTMGFFDGDQHPITLPGELKKQNPIHFE
jgi:hypothetical protein